MKRRNFIKGIAVSSAGLLLPTILFQLYKASSDIKKLHFVGLGGAGRNFLQHIHNKNIEAHYTYIDKKPKPDPFPPNINYVAYNPDKNVPVGLNPPTYVVDTNAPNELCAETINFIELCNDKNAQIESIIQTHFKEDETIVLLVGLGGQTGTNLSGALFTRLQAAQQKVILIGTTPFVFNMGRTWYTKFALQQMGNHKNIGLISNQQYKEEWGQLVFHDWFSKVDEVVYNRAMELIG